MGDYTDEQGIGRSFTPAEVEREAYRRELDARDHERRRCVAPVSFWRVAARMAPAEFNAPPAYAPAAWAQRLLPEKVARLRELVDQFNARARDVNGKGPAVVAAAREAFAAYGTPEELRAFRAGFTVES